MTRLLVDVDDELLAVAASKLGTTTETATINTALAQAVDPRRDQPDVDQFKRVTRRVDRQLSEVAREEMWRH